MRKKLKCRRKVYGTKDRPRLAVFRSARHFSGQLIDDDSGRTLLGVSTTAASFRSHNSNSTGNVKASHALGVLLAKKAKEAGITKVVFDRRDYLYHGRVRAFAEGVRKEGIEF